MTNLKISIKFKRRFNAIEIITTSIHFLRISTELYELPLKLRVIKDKEFTIIETIILIFRIIFL